VTLLWNKVVRNGLKINKKIYGPKHTGNIDYLMSLPNIGEANFWVLLNLNKILSFPPAIHRLADGAVHATVPAIIASLRLVFPGPFVYCFGFLIY